MLLQFTHRTEKKPGAAPGFYYLGTGYFLSSFTLQRNSPVFE